MFFTKKTAAAFLAAIMAMSCTAFPGTAVHAARRKTKTSVRIVSSPSAMQSGLAYDLKAKITKGKRQQIYWKADSNIVSVGWASGRCVCLKPGTVRITAYTKDGARSTVVKTVKSYPVFRSLKKAGDYVRNQIIGRNEKVRFETTKELPPGFMERYVYVQSDGEDHSYLGCIIDWHRFEEALNGRNYYHCYKFRYK